MMPPNTPVSIDGIPMIDVVSIPRPSRTRPSQPGKQTSRRAGESGDAIVSVRPIATPIANSNGRLLKIAPPDCAITCETIGGSQEKLALPTPSRMPATGNTETGSIMHLPIFCSERNAFLKFIC
jgi:hypothetical protein